MCLAAEATGQSPTAAANAQWLLRAKLREKLNGSRIVPVFSSQVSRRSTSRRNRATPRSTSATARWYWASRGGSWARRPTPGRKRRWASQGSPRQHRPHHLV